MATTIGEQLRLAREERGLPLREISNQTRISMRYLEAIETNDYKRLPGGIYSRGFIKAYAKCVGFDEKKAVEGYTQMMREQGHPTDDFEVTPFHSKVYTDTPATRSPVLTVFLAILILAILTLVALAAVRWYNRRSAQTAITPAQMTARQHAAAVPGLSARTYRLLRRDYEDFRY